MRDWDKSREVWQRVTEPQPVVIKGGIRDLRRESAELCGIYRHLMGILKGRSAELAGELYRREMSTANSLRGLELLRGEDGGKLKLAVPQGKESAFKMLQTGYQKTRNAVTEYTARMVDPETGGVFRELADRARGQCMLISELLGIL